MKKCALAVLLAFLAGGCAHRSPHPVTRLRRAQDESPEDFAERKQEMRDHAAEVREIKRENKGNTWEDALNQ